MWWRLKSCQLDQDRFFGKIFMFELSLQTINWSDFIRSTTNMHQKYGSK